jgi:hypothetical protein
VDGVNTTDPFTGYFGQQLNIESIEEIEVITLRRHAEFGRAQGGFANIITSREGTSSRGTSSSFSLGSPGRRRRRNRSSGAARRLGEVQCLRDLSFTDYYPFLSLSGPIVRDKVWYYLANEFIQVETPINAVSQAFITRTRGYREFGKATWQINQANKLALSLTLDRTKDENQGLNSLTAVEAGFHFERGGPTYTLKETAIFSPQYLLESSASWFDNAFQRAPTLNPDTNGNGVLFIDDRPDLGGNEDGFYQARERDPGRTTTGTRPTICSRTSITTGGWTFCSERTGWGRPPHAGDGCEGVAHEDRNCNGTLDQEYDLNQNGLVDPNEDVGLPGIPGSAGNGRFDSEDGNKNHLLDTLRNSGPTSFPFWNDRNGDHKVEPGEYEAPLFPDRDFTRDFNGGSTYGPNPYEFEDHRTRLTLREDFSSYVDGFGGNHDLKMGALYEHEGFDRDTVQRPIMDLAIRRGFSQGALSSRGAR